MTKFQLGGIYDGDAVLVQTGHGIVVIEIDQIIDGKARAAACGFTPDQATVIAAALTAAAKEAREA